MGEEPCGDPGFGLIERRPKEPNSGYLRQLVRIDNAAHRIRRVHCFDPRDVLLEIPGFAGFAPYPVAGREFSPAG